MTSLLHSYGSNYLGLKVKWKNDLTYIFQVACHTRMNQSKWATNIKVIDFFLQSIAWKHKNHHFSLRPYIHTNIKFLPFKRLFILKLLHRKWNSFLDAFPYVFLFQHHIISIVSFFFYYSSSTSFYYFTIWFVKIWHNMYNLHIMLCFVMLTFMKQ